MAARERRADPAILQAEAVSKSFPGVRALRDVSFSLTRGEILGLVGENGAGKSTLVRILTGVYRPDDGRLLIHGASFEHPSPRRADELGIRAIYQEFSLTPNLTVAENIFLGHEPQRFGLVDFREMRRNATAWLARLEIELDVDARVGTLGVANQQLVEVTRALAARARVLIMDEPTSALSSEEVEKLFGLVRQFRDEGVAVIFVSHRLDEVTDLCDRALVLRDGERVAEFDRVEFSKAELIRAMVGRRLPDHLPSVPRSEREHTLLEVVGLTAPYRPTKHLHVPSFRVGAGEVVGVAGLMGAGRSEFARALIGAEKKLAGEVLVEGRRLDIGSPADAVRNGMGFVPESRKEQALFLRLTMRENVSIASLPHLAKAGIVRGSDERRLALAMRQELEIRPPSIEAELLNLSGGNQQKVVIARWLAIRPKVLVLDEPTRGIDVGAKEEIYELIDELAEQGVGIVLISSELTEILRISHRVVVLREGEVTGEFDRAEASQERIMWLATHGTQHEG